MAVRTIDIFSGQTSRAAQALFDHIQGTFPREIAALTNALAEKTYTLWRSKAINASPWGKRYANILALRPAMVEGGGTAEVYADLSHEDALFFHMMENGVKPYSIKDALLKSQRVKESAGGVKYIVVPFRHRTPGSTKATSSFVSVIPDNVYEMVKEGKRVGPEYGKLAGLKRYGSKLHGQYLTFRVVTERSTGWQHPGKPATPVFEEVADQVERMIAETIENWIQAKLSEIESQSDKGQYGY